MKKTASRALIALAMVVQATVAFAGLGEPEFVPLGDLNTDAVVAAPGGSGATHVLSSEFYFAGTDGERGTELWRWGGGGPSALLTDIWPGPGSSNPTQFTPTTAYLFFVANDGVSGPEIWRARGSVQRLNEVQPGANHPAPIILGTANGIVWFTTPKTSGSTERAEIWAAQSGSLAPAQLGFVEENTITQVTVVANPSSLLFVASPLGSGSSNLFRINGVGSVTSVSQIRASGTPALPSTPVYAATPGFVCFSMTDVNSEPYIWTYSGTPTTLADVNPAGDSAPASFVSDGSTRICFSATTAANGRELWVTDGVATVMVNDAVPGAGSSNPEPMPMRQGQPSIFYRVERATTPGVGIDLWYSDLTNLAIIPDKLVAQGVHNWLLPTVVSPTELIFFLPDSGSTWGLWRAGNTTTTPIRLSPAVFNSVERMWNYALDGTTRNPYFIAISNSQGKELWRVGTSSAALVIEVAPGPHSSNTRLVGAYRIGTDLLQLFAATTYAGVTSLYLLDRTGSGSPIDMSVTSIYGNASSFPREFTEIGDVLFCNASDASGRSLWKAGGVPLQFSRVTEVRDAEQLVKFQGRLWFLARRAAGGPAFKELHYATVGPSGAVTVALHSSTTGLEITRLIAAAGKLFCVQSATAPDEFLRCILPDFSDGPTTGPYVRAADGTGISQLTASSARLYFTADHTGSTRRVWVTDGTPSGLVSGPDTTATAKLLGQTGDAAIFSTTDATSAALWHWDAQSSPVQTGSFALSNPPRQRTDGKPSGVEFNGGFYFTDSTGVVWKTDSTTCAAISMGLNSSRAELMSVFGNKLFYLASGGMTSWSLFTLDATGAGPAGVNVSFPSQVPCGMFAKNNGVYFAMSSSDQANLWQSDGTTPGTMRVPAYHNLATPGLIGYDLPMGTFRGHLVLAREEFGTGLEPAILNARPVLAQVESSPSGMRNQPLSFTYEQIVPSPPTDDDGDPLVISISNPNCSGLTRNGVPYTVGDPIAPGDTFVLQPPADFSGSMGLLTVEADDGFAHGSQSVAATINSPLDIWRQAQFTPEELADGTISAPLADPDGDGVCTALEFVFGRQAKTGENETAWSTQLVTQPNGKKNMRLLFIRTPTLAEGTKLTVEYATDLQAFSDWGASSPIVINTKFEDGPWQDPALVEETTLADGRVQVGITLPVALDGTQSSGVMRLRVGL